jgi:hypothetical protein
VVSGIGVMYNRRPEDLPEQFASTVDAIMQISGKAYTSLFCTISLLKLVLKIQDVIQAEKPPFYQGYLFAANLGSPDFFTIFDEIMETPVTNPEIAPITPVKKPVPQV